MRARCLIPLLAAAVLLGCQSDKPKGDLPALHAVRGKIVRGGQPVAGGSVRFDPTDAGDPDIVVSGEVKGDGSFELQTVHARSSKIASGAPAGNYKVTYTPALGDQTQGGANPISVTTEKTFTVQAGSNDITVELGVKK